MKSKNASFLFFYYLSLQLILFCHLDLKAQHVQDSVGFYYNSIMEITDASVTSNALTFFERKAEKAIQNKDTLNAAYFYELISAGEFKMGFYNVSESKTIKAIQLLDNLKDRSITIAPRKRLTNQLGMLYRKMEDYDSSNKFYKQALILSSDDTLSKLSIVNNIANNYADQGQFQLAINELSAYYDKVLQFEDHSIKATYIDNLGYYQSKIGILGSLQNMELALAIRQKSKDLNGLFSSYRHLSLYHFDRDNHLYAKKFANMAKTIADSLNSQTYQLESVKLMLMTDTNPYITQYLELNDAIENARLNQNNKFAAIKYNVSEKEKLLNENVLKLQASELENKTQQKITLIYLFIGLILLLSTIFLYFYIKSNHKKDKIQQVFKTETRISKKIHDELANDVSDLINYVENTVPASTESKLNLLNALEDVYLRTRDISTETASIDFDNFSESLKHLLIQHNKQNVKVVINDLATIDWDKVSDHKKLAVYRVLQELMVNMKKYSQANLVTIIFKNNKHKNEIWYTDDGIGCAIEKINKNGLLNAESRIKEVGGTLTFESPEGNGFKAKLIFNS